MNLIYQNNGSIKYLTKNLKGGYTGDDFLVLAAFEPFEIRFAFNPPQEKFVFRNYEAFFAFCGVILCLNNISFDNSTHWMNKGYNVKKYNLEELNFSSEKIIILHH